MFKFYSHFLDLINFLDSYRIINLFIDLIKYLRQPDKKTKQILNNFYN